MAAITSTQTGDWNVGATWVGGVAPAGGDTATVATGHVVTITANQAVDGIVIDSGGSVVVNAGIAVSAMTADLSTNGTLTMAAGSSLAFNGAGFLSLNLGIASVTNINGTSGSQCSITNAGASYAGIEALVATGIDTFVAKWLNTNQFLGYAAPTGSTDIIFEDCEFSLVGHAVDDPISGGSNLILRRCFAAVNTNAQSICSFEHAQPGCVAESLALGYLRDGTSKPGSNGLWVGRGGYAELHNAIVNATTPMYIEQAAFRTHGGILIDNLGYLPASMLPDTGSALDGAVVGAGISHWQSHLGSVLRSTAAKKTGDFGARVSPTASVVAEDYPLEIPIYIPIETGDNISVSVFGRRHTMTNDCAEIEIDPEGAWFTPAVNATTLTVDDTWYAFGTSASAAAGTSEVGVVRVVLRLKEYEAAAYFDWADMVVTAGGITYDINFDTWRMGLPIVSEPAEIDSTAVQAACTAALVAHNLDHLLLTPTGAADMTTEVADNTIMSRLLANGDTSAFVPSTDGLQLIRDAITAAAPLPFHPDASSAITVGNQDAGTYASCAADDGTRWTIGDEDGSPTIDVICEFNMGGSRVATGVTINGYFNRSGGGGYVVDVYAYNYTTASWDKLSSASPSEQMQDRANDADYAFALQFQHTNPVATIGEVKIRFQSTRDTTAGGDVLYLDHVEITGVSSGATAPAALASAIWEHVIATTVATESAGSHLHAILTLDTTISAGDTATSFTLTAGLGVASAYLGNLIHVKDATDLHFELRRITGWSAGRVVTVDRAFGFTPAPGDIVHIMGTGYLDAALTLADDAITLAKFDETTAWPLLASDAGATQVARVGADGDTLETLSDEIATNKTELDGLQGADGKAVISTDVQDLSATLDVNTKTITNGIIVAATLGADAITNAKIADDAIAVENIKDAAITAAKIATDAITSTKIAANAIGASELATDAIGADQLATSAVTEIALAAIAAFTGDGSETVTHDRGGADNLSYKVAGVGIDNAYVRAYLTVDFDAGSLGSAYIQGQSRTTIGGQWDRAMLLDPGAYTFQYHKQGYFGPDTKEYTVLAT